MITLHPVDLNALARSYRLSFMERDCTDAGWEAISGNYERMMVRFLEAMERRGLKVVQAKWEP